MTVIKARLDRETGAKFAALMEPLAAPGPKPTEKDPRTVGQRNADGFTAILDLALDHDRVPRAGGQRPHLSIAIDFEDLKKGLRVPRLRHRYARHPQHRTGHHRRKRP
ncbi:DUF222 domain-containing protein, partial [Saccharopolyspora sp. NPDC000995]